MNSLNDVIFDTPSWLSLCSTWYIIYPKKWLKDSKKSASIWLALLHSVRKAMLFLTGHLYSPWRTVRSSSFKFEIWLSLSASSLFSVAKSKRINISLTVRKWTLSNLESFRGTDIMGKTYALCSPNLRSKIDYPTFGDFKTVFRLKIVWDFANRPYFSKTFCPWKRFLLKKFQIYWK